MTTQRIEERNECRCPQCVQENNRGNCGRKDCCNYHNPNELVQSITTPRTEKKVAEFRKEYKSVERYSRIGQEDLLCDWLENTLAEAYQAGRDEEREGNWIEANQLLRSLNVAVHRASRGNFETNWEALAKKTDAELTRQHVLLKEIYGRRAVEVAKALQDKK